jgi:hypothetical protein
VLLATLVAGEDASFAVSVVATRLLARAGLAGGDAGFGPNVPPPRLRRLGDQDLTTPKGQQRAEGGAEAAAA